jgi:hypothetical protein
MTRETPEQAVPDRQWSMTDLPGRLSVSRATLYREIAAKRIRLTKVRGRSFVMESECVRYLRTRTDRKAA